VSVTSLRCSRWNRLTPRYSSSRAKSYRPSVAGLLAESRCKRSAKRTGSGRQGLSRVRTSTRDYSVGVLIDAFSSSSC
jgi:hypothetical protein